ncbi:MAG: spore coat protein U domain-containing protein [Nitrosomonadales bacterium]|nr:spore coat protein U domain-containing protein [Nitrosomonadales bacterium]
MQRKLRHIATAIALAGLLPAAAQAATTTAQVNVTATTVAATASINVSGALAFGSVQDTATATAQTSFDVIVSSGFPYAVALDGGANYAAGQSFMKDGGGLNAREYVLYQDAARLNVFGPAGSNLSGLTGTGAAQTYPLYASLLAAAGTTGAISDIVTITVTY